MTDRSKSDRTSVTISKRVHRSLRLLSVHVSMTQRDLLEMMILDWLKKHGRENLLLKEEEDQSGETG